MTAITVNALILDKVGKRFFNGRKWAAYLFACDCLERALPFYEREFPDDMRPHQAIETARRYANKYVRRLAVRDAVYTASNLIAKAMGWSEGWAERNSSAETMAWEAAHVSEWAVANAAINPQDLCLPGIALVSSLCDDEQEEYEFSDATFDAVKNEEVEWQTECLKHYLNT